MKKYKKYINDDMLNNIFSQFGNVFGIVSNPDITNDYGKCFGEIVLSLKIKNKKKIVLKDIIEFDKSKIKWKSAYPDELGRVLCLVDPYWCRMYKLDIKIEVPVTIQKSVVKEGCSNDQREYYLDTEFQIMNEAQFFKRRMVFHLKDWKYNEVEAVNNFNKRIMKLKDYYRAANETAKNYLIPSDHLISLRGKYNNVKKKIYKEWNDLFIKHCQNEKSKSITLTDLYNDLKVEDKSNVINFSSKP